MSRFKIYKFRIGTYFLWYISNKEFPKEVNYSNTVFENKSAVKGQISKASLVCSGIRPHIKCKWVFDVKKG
jgi:hypothetical protein